MIPGTPIQYLDFVGKVVPTPYNTKPDPTQVWLLTPDLILVGVPAQSKKLIVLDHAPEVSYTAEEQELMRSAGIAPKVEPDEEPKPFFKAGFIKIGKHKKYPAGMYKILAGGLGEDRAELRKAVDSLNARTKNKPFIIVSGKDGSWHVVIEVLDKQ